MALDWNNVGPPPGTATSGDLFARARRSLADGVSSPSRGAAHVRPYPLFMERGEGSELIDVDGNRYVDLMLGFGCLLHGHAHPRLVQRLCSAAGRGSLVASNTRTEAEVAELIQAMVPSADLVRLANTGTEAAMAALRIARAYTGCTKFVKFEGHYHGWADPFSVSSNPIPSKFAGHPNAPVTVFDSSGIAPSAVHDTVVVPWNDLDRLEAALDRHRGQIAAVVMEGVMANAGVIPPVPGYLEAVRAMTSERNVLLWIDETVTGFRLAPGGVQERFGVTADLSTFGKGLGAGLPAAAVTGRQDLLETLEAGRVLHYGTHNANPLVLELAHENLLMLTEDGSAAYVRLEELADRLLPGVRRTLSDAGCPAIVQSAGAMFQVMFILPGHEGVKAINSARDFADHVDVDRFRLFARLLLDEGVFMSALPSLHSVLSTVHTTDQIDAVIDGFGRAALRLAQVG